jgi:hypothetical protein
MDDLARSICRAVFTVLVIHGCCVWYIVFYSVMVGIL